MPVLDSLANAIAQRESGGNYNALGKTTGTGDRAYGKYQVMGANVPSWTKEVLGQSFSPQEFLKNPQAQDAVAKHKLGQYLQQYGNPEDAASVWFSGRTQAKAGNAADVLGTTTPQYVRDVANIMKAGPQREAVSGGGGVALSGSPKGALSHEQIIQNINAMEQQGAKKEEVQNYLDSLGSGQQTQRGNGYVTPPPVPQFPQTASDPQSSPFDGVPNQPPKQVDPGDVYGNTMAQSKEEREQNTARVANMTGFGGVVDTLSNMLAKTANAGKGVMNIPGALLGNKGAQAGLAQAEAVDQNLPETNPLQAAGAGAQLATLLPVGVGAKAVGTAVTGLKERSILQKTLEAVMPRLTSKVASTIGKTNPTGIMGNISAVAPKRVQQVADAIKGVFNPAKTLSENANNVMKAISTEAQTLKSTIMSQDHPYVFKELQSAFNKMDIPHFIKTSDSLVQKRAASIVSKFMEIAKSGDGKISSLLDARKAFDQWVEREYPRVFDESGNAVNQLVSNVRNTANKFIADAVPNAGVKASLQKQSLMYDAFDTLNEKAALGDIKSTGEIGTNRFSRWATNHPNIANLAKGTLKVGGTALGLGGVLEAGSALRGLLNAPSD